MSVIKAVLFDLDGTLLDRESSLPGFISDQYDRLNLKGEAPAKSNYSKAFIALDNGGLVWKDKVYTDLCKQFSITKISPEELLADYLSNFSLHCCPFPGLVETLERLSKLYSLGIITNGYSDFQRRNIAALGIEKYFKVILDSESEGIRKPDPEIFLRALSSLSISPEEAVFVGDNIEHDIKGAKATGFFAFWKRNGSSPENCVEADSSFSHLPEIPGLLKALKG